MSAKMTLCVKVRRVMKKTPPCPVGDDGEDPASDDDAVEEVGSKLAPGKL